MTQTSGITTAKKFHVFIDGSWLFRACGAGKALAQRLVHADRNFTLDFSRLTDALKNHLQPFCHDELVPGERILAISRFVLPADVDDWAMTHAASGITSPGISSTKNSVAARSAFAESARVAGYKTDVVAPIGLRPWMQALVESRSYQEKQVDTTVVKYLVSSTHQHPQDFHVCVTGDIDMLPAFGAADGSPIPNVVLASTHPDELRRSCRQSSKRLVSFASGLPPFFLQEHAAQILKGSYVYECAHCHRVFARPVPIPRHITVRPCCDVCFRSKEAA